MSQENHTTTSSTAKRSLLSNDEDDKDMMDITDLMTSCASELTMQEPFLCRRQSFQLQDAMAATQLMDRKMDSCEVPASLAAPLAQNKDKGAPGKEEEKVLFPRPHPEKLSDDFVPLPWNNLTLQQASVIVVHELVRLQALISGASVGESVFTCLYAHRPILCEMEDYFLQLSSTSRNNFALRLQIFLEKGSEDPLFCAQMAVFTCTCAIVEISSVFRGIVINSDIYEEEDFVSNTHDIPFFSLSKEHHSDQNSLQLYLETTADLLKRLPSSDTNRKPIHILRLSLTYLNGMLLFCSKMGKLSRMDLAETVESMQSLVNSLCQGLESLHEITKSSKGEENVDDSKEKTLVAQVFDSYVNRPTFGNTPVRKVLFLSPDESLLKLLEITQELDWAVCGLFVDGTTLARIDRMMRRFSSLNILSRSLIVLNLYFDDFLLGKYALQPLIVAHARQLEHFPQDLVQNEHGQVLLNRLAKPIYDMLKIQVSNRNRQRAYIEASMFQEWTSLQNEANLVDTNYRRDHNLDGSTPPAFGFYLLSCLLKLMNQHLTCGIEVGLFCGHDEICSAFWYRDFLLAALIKNLIQMRKGKEMHQTQALLAQQQQQQQQRAHEQATKEKAGKGKKKNHKNKHNQGGGKQQQQPQPSPPTMQKSLEEIEDELELHVLEAQRKVCQGLVRFIVAIRQAGYFPLPEYEFTSRRTIFERRFAVFSTIRHPTPLTFDDYLAGSDGSGVSVSDMCQSAMECFKAGRGMIESILGEIGSINVPFAPVQEKEARALQKVCVGNSVYLMKFGQQVSARSKETANGTSAEKKVSFEFDFDAHKEFCILKMS